MQPRNDRRYPESAADGVRRIAAEAEQRERAGAGAAVIEAQTSRPTVVDELHALRHACLDWRLARGDLAVYAVLLKHADAAREAFPGPKRISNLAAIAVSNVKASLRRLEDMKYIRVVRSGLRKANRYVILDSPAVPSKKASLAMQGLARELGMRTGPDAKRSRAAPKASTPQKLGMRTGPDDAPACDATGHAGRSATGHAGRSELGMRAGHELALELASELATAGTQAGAAQKSKPAPL